MKPFVTAAELLDRPENPAPAGGSVTAVRTRDGVTIRAAYWPATRPVARGTVLLVQGRAEFIEKYFEVVGELRERGYAVATFDWRGQGGSDRSLPDGRKGHVRHFDDFRLDLDAVADALLAATAKPHVVLAHSMGGCIALTAAAEGWLPAERLVATTPMIALSLVRSPRLARALAGALAAIGLQHLLVPGGVARSISTLPFLGNRLSQDEKRYARNALVAEALGAGAVGSPTIGWVRAAYAAMTRLGEPGFGRTITVPTLIVGAGDDPVCSTAAAEAFARSLGPGTHYLAIPGSRHEVLMETDAVRHAFWQAFDRFVADGSAVQEVEDLGMELPVATGDDLPSPRR